MKNTVFKLVLGLSMICLISTSAWAIRPIHDLRTPQEVENTIVEKFTSDAEAVAPTQTEIEEKRSQEVERIRNVLRLDELNRENTMADALRQENLEDRVRGHEDLQLAMAEKNIDLHLGKVLTDMHGNRVRMEEYVLRPEANQVQFLNLTMRDNRLDYVNYLATFNDILPKNIHGVWAKTWKHTGENGPAIYLTEEAIEYSNMLDKVNYGVDYFSPEWNSGFSQFELYEKSAYLSVNDIHKAGHERLTSAEDIEWDGIKHTSVDYIDKNLLATRIIYTFDDDTFLQIDDYMISEEGGLRQWRYDSIDNFLNDLANLVENFSALVFNTYKERIMTATEFEGRNIDTVSQFMHLVDVFEDESKRPWR
ncbi:hypothetical protein K8S19_00600 [bacterium]|nr:hypothetical protein [bacterium]